MYMVSIVASHFPHMHISTEVGRTLTGTRLTVRRANHSATAPDSLISPGKRGARQGTPSQMIFHK